MIMVATCKIHIENKVDKHIESDLNRVKSQLKQLNESELFTKEDRDRLTPIYEGQIEQLSTKLLKDAWNKNGRNLGYDKDSNSFNFMDKTINLSSEIEVKDAEILSNNQPGE